MIHIRNASLSFGSQTLFNDISCTIAHDQRVGVLGRNGTGKSTLLKIIAGQGHFDEGKLTLNRHKKIAYMPQEMVILSTKTVLDEALAVFEKYQVLEKEKLQLEEQLSSGTASNEVLERYTAVQEEYAHFDAFEARARTEKILKGLGFTALQWQNSVSDLSVGWKMRLVLAKLLLENADFYLFDEPTNHLDLPAKEWFFEFLKEGQFGFLLVSHDRHYLEQACDYILALEMSKAILFHGNLNDYLKAREQQQAALQAAYVKQQKDIARKQATIDRFRASASKAKMAQSIIKQLDKIERIEIEPLLPTISLTFPPTIRSGAVALTITNLSHSFDHRTLFKNASGTIMRNERVALVAPNGTGKTTLFNLICGKLQLQQGTVTFGANVQYALFEQDQLRALNADNTVYEEVLQVLPTVSESTIRTFLGCFLFSGDAIQKKVSVLSGGERNRVAMVKVLLQKATMLLLDEPTNHLDLYAKDILLQALKVYEGTMLFVSHDHSFLQEVATCIWELTEDGIHSYPGTYESYLYAKKMNKQPARVAKACDKTQQEPAEKQNSKEKYVQNKEIASLEAKIERLEKEIEQLHLIFAYHEYGSPQWDQASKKLEQNKNRLSELTDQWEKLLSDHLL